ncbi:hypothetical protein SUGI_0391280 [Cryptomeria japonica]|nr:hypothetical protein SUGI_0391280 [Cryptomeria japonica]
MIISRIKEAIAKVVNGKLASKKVKAYAWWEKKMEEKCKTLKLVDFSICHVYREGNRATDWLANEGIKQSEEVIGMEGEPFEEELKSIIAEDMNLGPEISHTGLG